MRLSSGGRVHYRRFHCFGWIIVLVGSSHRHVIAYSSELNNYVQCQVNSLLFASTHSISNGLSLFTDLFPAAE